MQLFKVTLEFDMYVVADTHEDAEEIAERDAGEEVDNCIADAVAATHIDDTWKDSLPYGENENMTVSQWAKELGIADDDA